MVAAWRVTRHLASNAALGESRGRGASAERWYHHPVGFPDFIHDPNRPAGHGCHLLTAFSSCFAWCLGCYRSAAWRRSPRWAWAGAAGDFLVISSPPRHQPLSVSVSHLFSTFETDISELSSWLSSSAADPPPPPPSPPRPPPPPSPSSPSPPSPSHWRPWPAWGPAGHPTWRCRRPVTHAHLMRKTEEDEGRQKKTEKAIERHIKTRKTKEDRRSTQLDTGGRLSMTISRPQQEILAHNRSSEFSPAARNSHR